MPSPIIQPGEPVPAFGGRGEPRTLDISEKTVRNHVSNIYKKLRIYDR